MVKLTNWIVVTGPPSSGKTTLINQLANLGYPTSSEVAREFLNGMYANHLSNKEIYQKALYIQRQILAMGIKRERCHDPEELVIFDRGIPDSIAYFRLYDLDDSDAKRLCRAYRYKEVFFCSGLPVVYDGLRRESQATAKLIELLLYDAYKSLGYQPIILPPVSVEERMKIILGHMN